MNTPEIHPIVYLLPPMPDIEYGQLVADIKAHGLREPIVLHPDGRVIDGRHRLRACLEAHRTPKYVTWDGSGNLADYVLSLNVRRRHLTASERAEVARKLVAYSREHPSPVEANTDETSPHKCGLTVAQAAGSLRVSKRSVENAIALHEHGTPELVQAVESGEIAVTPAATLARETPEVQREAVQRVREHQERPAQARQVKPLPATGQPRALACLRERVLSDRSLPVLLDAAAEYFRAIGEEELASAYDE